MVVNYTLPGTRQNLSSQTLPSLFQPKARRKIVVLSHAVQDRRPFIILAVRLLQDRAAVSSFFCAPTPDARRRYPS